MRVVTVAVAIDTIEPYPANNMVYTVCVYVDVPKKFITSSTVSLPMFIITREEWEAQGGE